MKIIILTSTHLRHVYFRKLLALFPDIQVLKSFCENSEGVLEKTFVEDSVGKTVQQRHIAARAISEEDFFDVFCRFVPDQSNPVMVPRGAINSPETLARIQALAPDVLVAYGCSLIQPDLLQCFPRRVLNVHLGLSPYYRGTATNFWPLVNAEPEYVGATIMYMDEGIDTGEIIHQVRARCYPADGPHQIGNRLIADMTLAYANIIRQFHNLMPMPQPNCPSENNKYYRRADFSPESVNTLYANFQAGMIPNYLKEQCRRDARVPLVQNLLARV